MPKCKAKAPASQEYMIRQKVDGEEVYLMSIGADRARDLMLESEYGNRARKKKKKKPEEPPKDDNKNVTATWTPDDTKAMVFHSIGEAENMIRKWNLLRNGTIIRV